MVGHFAASELSDGSAELHNYTPVFLAYPCPTPVFVCTTQPYVTDQQKALIQASAGVTDTIDICDFFRAKRIGIITNTSFQQQLDSLFPACPDSRPEIKTFTNRNEIVEAVIRGNIDAYVTNGRILEFYKRESSNANALTVVELRDTKSSDRKLPLLAESFVVIMKREREGLRKLVDMTLGAVADDGTYEKIFVSTPQLGTPVPTIQLSKRDCEAVVFGWKWIKRPESSDAGPQCVGNYKS